MTVAAAAAATAATLAFLARGVCGGGGVGRSDDDCGGDNKRQAKNDTGQTGRYQIVHSIITRNRMVGSINRTGDRPLALDYRTIASHTEYTVYSGIVNTTCVCNSSSSPMHLAQAYPCVCQTALSPSAKTHTHRSGGSHAIDVIISSAQHSICDYIYKRRKTRFAVRHADYSHMQTNSIKLAQVVLSCDKHQCTLQVLYILF